MPRYGAQAARVLGEGKLAVGKKLMGLLKDQEPRVRARRRMRSAS